MFPSCVCTHIVSFVVHWFYIIHFIITTVTTISFDQNKYSVDEFDETVELVLIFNNSLPFDVTITVKNDDNLATGE